MLNCPRCNRRVKITSTIKSRVRADNYKYRCPCGEQFSITPEDVEISAQKRLYWLTARRKKCPQKQV